MKSFPIAVVNYYNAPARKRAYCLLIRRYDPDGNLLETVRGTSWDADIPIDDNSPADIYYSTSGGALSDIDSSNAMNVDNGEFMANFDAITSEALQAGLWSVAKVDLFVVNPDAPNDGKDYLLKDWTVGQTTVERLNFSLELRGKMQSMQQPYGWLVGANCPHTLGDSKCTKDLTAFTVTGTLDSVSDDGLTLFDSVRTEAGPTGSSSIASITLGNPSKIYLVTPMSLLDGAIVLVSVSGPDLLNGPQIARNPVGTYLELNIDSTSADPFISGTVTPLSGSSGYWAYGWIELTSGANSGNGIRREIKWSKSGSWGLQEAFPFAAGIETYRMVAGCDKLHETCITKFDNVLNYLGFIGVKGQDWMVQVGRSE